ncbi:hypothetical protein [Thermoactinomyces sp. DSM 45892]|uniref:hypothetical protein n=1 Tax=Thermoactinomyces sp. DSM 45892 TaxID=1882753 RepID=UPI00089564E2|nr:hypothetical protein [Thermoactinomyces sp. DSM 45892]SDY85202.1 hypothetical protein SAMN05444416_10974 [Thermoactinomyces sp. DSM 45892]
MSGVLFWFVMYYEVVIVLVGVIVGSVIIIKRMNDDQLHHTALKLLLAVGITSVLMNIDVAYIKSQYPQTQAEILKKLTDISAAYK